MALLSAATLRSRHLAEVSASDSATLTILGDALAVAERAAAVFLGYPGSAPSWESASRVLRVSGHRFTPRQLSLGLAPITAIASIYQDVDLVFASSTLIPSTDYEQEDLKNGTILHLLPRGTTPAWYTGRRQIKITCTAGYANEAAIDKSLADALYRWVASWWMRRANRHLTSQAQGQVTQGLRELEAMPPDVEALLVPWKLLGVVGVS